MTIGHIHTAIAKRFPAPEWATFFEVRDDAGFKAHRSADVVTMNTWPSRGLAIHGIEIKVSRSDWLRELANPAKSASIQRFCDAWWLAVSDDEVAKEDEIPALWGFLVLRGKKLVTVKPAPTLKPEVITRGFLAAILRNATKGLVPGATVNELVEEKIEERLKHHHDWQLDAGKHAIKDLQELRQRVQVFEEASGIKLNDRYAWGDMKDPTKLGAAVKSILSGGTGYTPGELKQAKNLVDSVSAGLAEAIEAVGALGPKNDLRSA